MDHADTTQRRFYRRMSGAASTGLSRWCRLKLFDRGGDAVPPHRPLVHAKATNIGGAALGDGYGLGTMRRDQRTRGDVSIRLEHEPRIRQACYNSNSILRRHSQPADAVISSFPVNGSAPVLPVENENEHAAFG